MEDRDCPTCGRTFRPRYPTQRYCRAVCWTGSAERRAMLRGIHAARYERLLANDPPPPSPQEIAEACAAIRAEWSDAERLARLRPDERPVPWEPPGGGSDLTS